MRFRILTFEIRCCILRKDTLLTIFSPHSCVKGVSDSIVKVWENAINIEQLSGSLLVILPRVGRWGWFETKSRFYTFNGDTNEHNILIVDDFLLKHLGCPHGTRVICIPGANLEALCYLARGWMVKGQINTMSTTTT